MRQAVAVALRHVLLLSGECGSRTRGVRLEAVCEPRRRHQSCRRLRRLRNEHCDVCDLGELALPRVHLVTWRAARLCCTCIGRLGRGVHGVGGTARSMCREGEPLM